MFHSLHSCFSFLPVLGEHVSPAWIFAVPYNPFLSRHTVGSGPQDQWTRSPDPQRANRRYTGGQGDPPQFSRNWGNPWETIFWWGLGGNGHAQRPPGYHTIHLGQGKSPNLHFRNHSSTKPCFSGSILGPRNLPGPAEASLATQQILDNGRSRGYPGQGQG